MSFNTNLNAGMRNTQGIGRKMKRVSDVNAIGISAPSASTYMQPTQGSTMIDPMMSGGIQSVDLPMGGFNNGSISMQTQNYGYVGTHSIVQPQSQQRSQTYNSTGPQSSFGIGPTEMSSVLNTGVGGDVGVGSGGGIRSEVGGSNQFAGTMPQFTMFQQPIVQDMAMQYGQRLADQGKQLVENQFEKWIPVAKLKYYFAVDNKYVINKLRLLFFPFTHKDWSLKYDQENPVQPRYDINAPDLYIPTMAYITYVVVAGLMLGMQKRFSPEQLGIQASSALAYSIFELVVYSITLYVVNIKTNLKTLDLLAFAGYKFAIIVLCLLVSTLFHGVGYYAMLAYSSLTLGFFLLRTLKTKVLNDSSPTASSGAINYDPYGNPQQLDYSGGRKRKLYFLFLIVGGQAFLSFILSKHLYLPDAATLKSRNIVF